MTTGLAVSIHLNSPENQPQSAHKWRALLYDRGLTDSAIERAGLRPEGQGWRYPITTRGQAQRWKAFPGQGGAKYRWLPAKPPHVTFYDPRGDLAGHIAAAGGALILAEGEPDVWACWSAGMFNATCTMHGAGVIPAWLVDELHRLNVRALHLWPDRDSAGLNGAAKLRAALAGSQIRLDVHALPDHLGEKADIGNLLQAVGAAQLAAALEACPPLALPDSTPLTPLARPERPSAPLPGESSDLYERYCLEVETAAVAAWNIAPPNAKQLSRRNFSSPYREDKNPSAQWNYTAHGFTDYATGEFTNTKQVAELLGFDSWEHWRAHQRPALSVSGAVTATRFPLGLPYTLNKRYLNAHRRVSVKAQINAAAVDYFYHQIAPAALPDGAWLSAGGFRQLARAAGFDPSSHLCTTGLDQLAAWGRVERLEVDRVEWLETEEGGIGKKCNLYTLTQKVYRLRFLVVPTTGPAPKVIYRFRAWPDSLARIAQRWRMLSREHRYREAPDNVQVEWGDLADDEIALWDDYRAPLYALWAAERAHAAEKHADDLAYLEADFERIRAGSYRPVTLLEGAQIRNATDYADALKAARVAAAGEKGISTHRLAYETGRSYSAEVRARDRVAVIAVPQRRTIAADQVTDYQRACGLVFEERDGKAVVKAPSVEKLRDHAAPEEIAAAESISQAQRQRGELSAESRRRERVREATPAAQFKAPDSQGDHRPEIIPEGYSNAHLRAQYELCPLPPEFRPYDAETGELYELDQLLSEPRWLWKAGARWLAEWQEAEAMSTFVELSEPKERSHEQEAPRTNAEAGAGIHPATVGDPRQGQGDRPASERNTRPDRGVASSDGTRAETLRPGEQPEARPSNSHDCETNRGGDRGRATPGDLRPARADDPGGCNRSARIGGHASRWHGLMTAEAPIVHIDGKPYTSAQLERRARRLAELGGAR